ncbi:MAG: glycosyltransferase family 4 protein [Actinomycetota bacterium]
MNARRILLWHGYLLTGSGSNIYAANTARRWRAAGHDVLLVCQERAAHVFDFVDAAGDFAGGNRSWDASPTGAPPAAGRCTVVRPDIAGLLPVYVLDDYEGFSVKRFVDLTDDELERYTRANVAAFTSAIERHRPDAIIVGHEVMGPAIARRACAHTDATYLAKLHGSALEYAVKVQERYRDLAREGLCGAQVVVGGSRYMVAAASAVVPGWERRAAVVNPGCDVDLFRPRSESVSSTARAKPPDARAVGFVGKLIAAKGVHDLLAALGLTSAPGLRLAVVGYGGFEPRLRALAEAFARGDLGRAEAIARAGESGAPLNHLATFLSSPRVDGDYVARAAAVPVEFRGRLEHGPLARLLPMFDVLVVPSKVPEAFGMVAAEAAACGVLPIVPRHSGIGEVGAALEDALGAPGLVSYDPASPIEGIAAAIDRTLTIPPGERVEMEAVVVELARRMWSWEHVATRLLELALDPPGGPARQAPIRARSR